ncbi:type II secretory pathway pseudopilin PulG [Vogesella indigofera]|uniref:Type II secretory pathway pseudopilin PulG n=1 Tax=Vogesella indigofera TaxID=45465 RepID=A0A495B3B8_VOGIN|nr:type II secretion system protein [Vogesella indigofera]RKQ55436.1 type II secretory pathway pseudopilin PulG [Vogesella indigofera]
MAAAIRSGSARRRARRAPAAGQRGFTYLGLLVLIAVIGWMLAATGEVWSTVQQRQREQELLFVGNQYREAIRLYYERSPAAAKRYPPTLADLLLDKRYPTVQRYLRQLYPDPMTSKPQWGLLRAPDGGIAGVYSLGGGVPFKVDQFEQRDAAFKGARSYARWQFSYQIVGGAALQPDAANEDGESEQPFDAPADNADTGADG